MDAHLPWNGADGTSPARTVVSLTTAGAGRGAQNLAQAFAGYNARAQRLMLASRYVDPVPQRATQLAERARAMGVPAQALEARIEDVLAQDPPEERSPVVLNVDRPLALAGALAACVAAGRSVLGYLLMRMPDRTLFGLRMAIESKDDEMMGLGALLFSSLAGVTARAGSAWVLGDRGLPEHILGEPVYRSGFADHLLSNLDKLVAGIEPESSPFELTTDGRNAFPLSIRDHRRSGWGDPGALALESLSSPQFPLIRGSDFAIAELGRDGIRFHLASLRALDGRVSVHKVAAIDPAMLDAIDAEERERALREREAAMQRAQRTEISRLQPIFTTD